MRNRKERRRLCLHMRDMLITAGILMLTALVCGYLRLLDDGDIYVSMLYLLAVTLISRLTNGFFYGIAASVVGVIGVNYVFTFPYFEFNLSIPGYPLAFLSMLLVSITTSALTTQIKAQEKQRYRAQLEEMRSNLFRAVSHDLRTPLTAISGAASALRSVPDMPEEQRNRLLGDIAEDAEWMVRMVENLLSITRINAESSGLHKSPEAAEEVLSDAVLKFRKRFPEMKATLNVPDELLMVPMDPVLIRQVVTNLLENAVLHGQTTTRVDCRLLRDGDWAQVEVSDDGVGIAKTRLEAIFDPTMAKTTDIGDGKRGMGIGLSVCRAIINAHGGTIRAYNRNEGGAKMVFRLPLDEMEETK